ncbi:hypothetical protein ACJX0J_013813, partial [Zea mays]
FYIYVFIITVCPLDDGYMSNVFNTAENLHMTIADDITTKYGELHLLANFGCDLQPNSMEI